MTPLLKNLIDAADILSNIDYIENNQGMNDEEVAELSHISMRLHALKNAVSLAEHGGLHVVLNRSVK